MEQLTTKQQLIIEGARAFIGTKWRHRGRNQYGIDCIGLVVKATANAGITMQDRTNYGREPWRDGLEQELINHFGKPKPKPAMRAGDIALMKWDSQPEAGHVGIITNHPSGGFSLIHSYSEISVTEHIIDDEWLRRIVKVFRP